MNKYKKAKGLKPFAKVSNAFNQAGKAIGGAANKVGKAINHGLGDVGSLIKKTWNEVVSAGQKAVEHIKKIFKMIQTTINQVINSDFVQLIFKTIIPCVKLLKGMGQTFYSVIMTIYQRVTLIISSGGAGLAQVFVDLICNFDEFRAAINALIRAIKDNNTITKFYSYGEFAGRLVKALGSRRVNKIMHNLMNN